MNEFYIKHMNQAHEDKRWDDRRNYANMAGIDIVEYFYLREAE